MPVYTYHCDNCGNKFDRHQDFNEPALVVCPDCRKHALRKVYRPAGVVFKGSGFYVTDKKAKSSVSTTGNGAKKPAKESAGTETKSEAKAEPKAEKPKKAPKNDE